MLKKVVKRKTSRRNIDRNDVPASSVTEDVNSQVRGQGSNCLYECGTTSCRCILIICVTSFLSSFSSSSSSASSSSSSEILKLNLDRFNHVIYWLETLTTSIRNNIKETHVWTNFLLAPCCYFKMTFITEVLYLTILRWHSSSCYRTIGVIK